MADETRAEGSLADTAKAVEKTLVQKIDDLHFEKFNGTLMGNHTDLWNQVYEFKEAIKKLVAPE